MDNLFNSSFGLKIDSKQVVGEIIRFMEADKEKRYKITIGTDSERYNGALADFVIAVVVHRVGNGGRYFWRRVELTGVHTLRDRIIKEVLFSIEIAKEILTILKEAPQFSVENGSAINWDFEIHADIGENGETKSMIQEVVGMIRANNFEARTKPDSYAASNVADRHV
ncbi:MAG: ribonuclease H-like YkuK family protein [Patescibacteria group bacterium]